MLFQHITLINKNNAVDKEYLNFSNKLFPHNKKTTFVSIEPLNHPI